MVRRVWLLCLALLFSGVAFALVPSGNQPQYRASSSYPWVGDTTTACTTYVEAQSAASSVYIITLNSVTGLQCNAKYTRRSDGVVQTANTVIITLQQQTLTNVCPANSTAVTGGCQCASGYDESGGQCVKHVNQCTSQTGQASTISWTEGYTRTSDEGDTQAVGSVNVIPTTICSAGCNVSVQKIGPGVEYFVSQQPTAQGLYRRSRDMPGVNLGTECTAGANAGNQPTAPEPACPGVVGMVGNKPTCISTADKPVPTAPLPTPDKPAIAGNPAAGAKPPSGEGSGQGSAGRTPSAGTGGNAGGGAAAGMGGKGGGAGGTAAGTGTGTGTTGGNSSGSVAKGPEGTEQAACGAPGQPVCAVKVDEGTMPGLGDTFKPATDKLDENFTSTSQAINAIKDDQSKPSWSFSFQLPTGCTAYTPSGFSAFNVTIDPCAWQGTIHDLMSLVWAAATAFCLIGMVGRTFRST